MSLSQTNPTTKGEKTNCSDLPFMPENEFMELVWENDQIVMQGRSDRHRKSSFSAALPCHTSAVQAKEIEDAIMPKLGKFKEIESIARDFSSFAPSAHTELDAQDGNMVPLINYLIDDSLRDDYGSEFLNEFLEVNLSSLSGCSNAAPSDRINSFAQIPRDSHNKDDSLGSKMVARDSERSRIKTSQLFQLPHQCQSAVPSTKSRATGIATGRRSKTHQGLCEALLNARLPKSATSSKPLQRSSDIDMNFSHFSRPAALAKATLQNVDKLRSSENASTSVSSNPMQSKAIESTSALKSVSGILGQTASVLPKVELKSSSKPLEEVISVEQSEAVCLEDTNNKNTQDRRRSIDSIQSSSFAASTALRRHEIEIEKGPAAIVASSSQCSGNSVEATANDSKHREKRKYHEEESEYQSEDLEEDSVGLKKPDSGRDSKAKRSRAAKVHNLSERRRRDRINEKMHALQELIPNCNKVDKASMLDEAIEYLKSLRMQVQMMSMGSGLCMPPVVLPAGMQHMHPHTMGHFWPMGGGMGMGMGNGVGYGMGMYDMNGVLGFPLIPIHPIHGPHFSCPTIPGAPGLHGMPGSTSLQMFGVPGQELPVVIPVPPACTSSSGLTVKASLMPEVSGTKTSSIPATDIAHVPSLKDQQHQNINLDTQK